MPSCDRSRARRRSPRARRAGSPCSSRYAVDLSTTSAPPAPRAARARATRTCRTRRGRGRAPASERLGRRLLDDEAAVELPSGRARRREGAHVLVAALAQQPQRHRADGAGGADDGDARRHRALLGEEPERLVQRGDGLSTSLARDDAGDLMDDVEMISMLMPASASASNMSAATPGWLFMPAPMRRDLPDVGSRSPRAPISSRSPSRSARCVILFGSVKRCRRPSETFCTIMSMFTPRRRARGTRARRRRAGRTRKTVASQSVCVTPEMIAFSSTGSSSSTIQVPSASLNVERTWRRTPWLRANSTDRAGSTFAPLAAISSISS